RKNLIEFSRSGVGLRDETPPIPPGPEGSNGNGIVRAQWGTGVWLFVLVGFTRGNLKDAHAALAVHVANRRTIVDHKGHPPRAYLLQQFLLNDRVRTMISGTAHVKPSVADPVLCEPRFRVFTTFVGASGDKDGSIFRREIVHPSRDNLYGLVFMCVAEELAPIRFARPFEVMKTMLDVGQSPIDVYNDDILARVRHLA